MDRIRDLFGYIDDKVRKYVYALLILTAAIGWNLDSPLDDLVEGNFERVGIGVTLEGWWYFASEAHVVTIIENAPAHTAGVKPGDVILKVDGHSGIFFDTVWDNIDGPKGSRSILTIRRDGEVITIPVVRDLISLGRLKYLSFEERQSDP